MSEYEPVVEDIVSIDSWNLQRFDQILERVERKIIIDDQSIHKCVGVRWYGEGAFVREALMGLQISRKQQWIIKTGDVVYNKLFAWKGAFGIADESVDGCIVSDKFPTYRVKPDQVEPRFLGLYFKLPQLAHQAERLSKGAAAISKLTLNPPQFWDLMIPLPPLEVQRKIIQKIDLISSKVREAKTLHIITTEEIRALVKSYISNALKDISITGQLGSVLKEPPSNGWSVRCDNMIGGTAVLSLGAVNGYQYKPDKVKWTSEETIADSNYWLHNGDLLMSRGNTPELLGHAAIYNGKPSPCIYPDLLMRLVVDPQKADKQFVHLWLQSSVARSHIDKHAKGTNPTMKKISQGVVTSMPFPIGLDLARQRQLVSNWAALLEKINSVETIQANTSVALNALMPSVLDKGLKAELVTSRVKEKMTKVIAKPVVRPLLLLEFLNEHNRRSSNKETGVLVTALMKYSFLFQMEGTSKSKYYHFTPYHYGPFDKAIYTDLNYLKKAGLIIIDKLPGDSKTSILIADHEKADKALETLPEDVKADVSQILDTYGRLNHSDLLNRVYKKYPAFAVRSRLRKRKKG